jgi:hypothetical protein
MINFSNTVSNTTSIYTTQEINACSMNSDTCWILGPVVVQKIQEANAWITDDLAPPWTVTTCPTYGETNWTIKPMRYYRHDNSTAESTWNFTSVYFPEPIPYLEDRLSEIIRTRISPRIISGKQKALIPTKDIREMRARETLRRVIGEDKYRLFLKKGFVTVPAKSGLIYQIWPGYGNGGITNVWDCGKLVERLCVVLQGEFPPTDVLIMRYLLILNNEDQFRSLALKHKVVQPSVANHSTQETEPSLVDVFNTLKKTYIRRYRKSA